MNLIFQLSFLLILYSCASHSDPNLHSEKREDSAHLDYKLEQDSIKYQKDTLSINGEQLVRTFKDGTIQSINFLLGDSVVRFANYYFESKFIDINEDGFKDIRILVFSNTPNQCQNYLFDPTTKTYRLVENSDLDIQLIKGTTLFYSYNSTGCSDMNFESYLSKIDNWKEVKIGRIDVTNCGQKDDGIRIYKKTESDEKLIATMPVERLTERRKSGKLPFIRYYWNKHYSKFE